MLFYNGLKDSKFDSILQHLIHYYIIDRIELLNLKLESTTCRPYLFVGLLHIHVSTNIAFD